MKIPHAPLDWPLPDPLIPIPPELPPCATPFFSHRVKAGFPSPAEGEMEPPLDLNEFLVRNKTATFFFRVSGDSVNEEGIFDGDLLVADRSIRAKHDHLVVASVDGDFTVKKLYHRGSVVELRPANPAYQPIRFSEGQEVLVWGVVRGVARALAV